MAENKGVLPSSNVNTLGNANNKWENVYANKFTGALTGNASTASRAAQLTTARSINGTNFNGTGNITTANWGTARNISIADATATNTGTGVSVNGSGNVTLKLPATIKASITGNCSGNAATATKATQDSAGQQINSTYIKALSISDKTITYTKGNNTTGTLDVSGAVPAGFIGEWGGNTIPAGWLLCDGSAVSRTTYAKLFSAIGTTWGAGNGSTTFNLPNSVGRFAEGASTSGSYKSAGLPNIKGEFGANEAYWFAKCGNIGALTAKNNMETNDRKYANAINFNVFSENFLGANHVSIDASKSSSVYGNSTTVQPPSFAVKYIIKY